MIRPIDSAKVFQGAWMLPAAASSPRLGSTNRAGPVPIGRLLAVGSGRVGGCVAKLSGDAWAVWQIMPRKIAKPQIHNIQWRDFDMAAGDPGWGEDVEGASKRGESNAAAGACACCYDNALSEGFPMLFRPAMACQQRGPKGTGARGAPGPAGYFCSSSPIAAATASRSSSAKVATNRRCRRSWDCCVAVIVLEAICSSILASAPCSSL